MNTEQKEQKAGQFLGQISFDEKLHHIISLTQRDLQAKDLQLHLANKKILQLEAKLKEAKK